MGEADCGQEIRHTGGCAWSPVCESQCHHVPYSLQAASLKWTDTATASCSQRLYKPWLQCSETGWCERRRQCTCEQVPWEDRQCRHAGNCDVKRRCWRQATRDTRLQSSCHCLSWGAQLAVVVQGRSYALHAFFTAYNETYCGLILFLILDFEKFNCRAREKNRD